MVDTFNLNVVSTEEKKANFDTHEPHVAGVYLRINNINRNVRGRWRYVTFDEMFGPAN